MTRLPIAFITTNALLAGTIPIVAHGQERVTSRVQVDVSAGLAMATAPQGFRSMDKIGAEVVVGARYRLSRILDLRVYGEAIVFHSTGPESISGGRHGGWEFDPLLALQIYIGPKARDFAPRDKR